MSINISNYIKEFIQIKEKNISLLHYNLNIIDELHANENAHTRILLKLLNFELNRKKVILDEFLTLLNEKLVNDNIPVSDDYKISGQFEFIDGYIWSDSQKTAVIIENKINWACDQKEQIQRYIQTTIKGGIDKKNIFVVYLTDNGMKKVSDGSLTNEAKELLDWESPQNKGRYIEANYQNDILPFLYKIFNYFSFSKENILKSAIFQYIDYLEGRFMIRKNEKEFKKAMSEDILEILNLDNNLTKRDKIKEIEELQWQLWNTLDVVKDKVFPDRKEARLANYKEYFEENKGSFDKCSTWGEGLIFYKKFNDYSLKFEVYPKDDETDIVFKIQDKIDDKDFIENILKEMNFQTYFDKDEEEENFYKKKFNASENNQIQTFISDFIQEFDKAISKI